MNTAFQHRQELAPYLKDLFPAHDAYIEYCVGVPSVFFLKNITSVSILQGVPELHQAFYSYMKDLKLRESLYYDKYRDTCLSTIVSALEERTAGLTRLYVVRKDILKEISFLYLLCAAHSYHACLDKPIPPKGISYDRLYYVQLLLLQKLDKATLEDFNAKRIEVNYAKPSGFMMLDTPNTLYSDKEIVDKLQQRLIPTLHIRDKSHPLSPSDFKKAGLRVIEKGDAYIVLNYK